MNARLDIKPPDMLARRPRDKRGFVIPWFVQSKTPEGEPDFVNIPTEAVVAALTFRCCWICGQRLGDVKVFVCGPVSTLLRNANEPPSHLSCARYAAQVCPFLANPRMRRNTKAHLPDSVEVGIHIKTNPGIVVLNKVRKFQTLEISGGLMFKYKNANLEWWREGRLATLQEIAESVSRASSTIKEIRSA